MLSKNAAKLLLKFNVVDQVVQIVLSTYDFGELNGVCATTQMTMNNCTRGNYNL